MRRCVRREAVGRLFTIRGNQLHIEAVLIKDLEILRDEQRQFPNPSCARATVIESIGGIKRLSAL
jgi:hypothetical protein